MARIQVISMPRSGSNYLAHTLHASLPEYRAYIEPLDVDRGYRQFHSIDEFSRRNEDFFSGIESNNVVVKHMPIQLLTMKQQYTKFYDLYRQYRWDTYILYRQDLFEQVLSWIIADKTQAWIDDPTVNLFGRTKLLHDEFKYSFHFMCNEIRSLIELKKDFSIDAVMTYENLYNKHSSINTDMPVFKYINAGEVRESVLRKNPSKHQVFTNLDEMRKYYQVLCQEFDVVGARLINGQLYIE